MSRCAFDAQAFRIVTTTTNPYATSVSSMSSVPSKPSNPASPTPTHTVKKNPTVFCDLDGTVYNYRRFEHYQTEPAVVCPAARETLQRWRAEGVVIVITTARPEYLREFTLKEMEANGIPHDQLVMGIGRGPRFLINDEDPAFPDERRATAYSLHRNEGLARCAELKPW